LERSEILKLKVSNSFVEYVEEVLLFYPPVPYFIESDIVNEDYSSNKMIRWDLSEHDEISNGNVTHWMIEVKPHNYFWQLKRIYVPYDQYSYVVNLTTVGCYDINVIAKNLNSASRSKTKIVNYINPVQNGYTAFTQEKSDTYKGCFEGRSLIKMADLKKKFAKDIVVGDVVMGGDGKG